LISIVDTNMSGTIDFAEFLQVIDYQKMTSAKDDGSSEIVHAFTACGGNPDKSGFVKCDRVRKEHTQ
jgi:calmodulin